jgi:hypothetical protein
MRVRPGDFVGELYTQPWATDSRAILFSDLAPILRVAWNLHALTEKGINQRAAKIREAGHRMGERVRNAEIKRQDAA